MDMGSFKRRKLNPAVKEEPKDDAPKPRPSGRRAAAATGNIVDNETPDPPTGYSRSLAAGPGSAAPSLEVALGYQANSASVPDFTLVNQVIFADPTTAYATVGTPASRWPGGTVRKGRVLKVGVSSPVFLGNV